MKKVYLIYEACGSWEDYREWLVDARFDKDESDEVLRKFKNELENKRQQLLGLEVHVDNCMAEDECVKCNEFFKLKVDMDLADTNGYVQREIEVLEKGD